MSKKVPSWFKNEVIKGFKRTYSLNLPGTPASESVKDVAQNWVYILWSCRAVVEEQEAHRIEKAFTLLLGRIDRWPGPSLVISHLPKRQDGEDGFEKLTKQAACSAFARIEKVIKDKPAHENGKTPTENYLEMIEKIKQEQANG